MRRRALFFLKGLLGVGWVVVALEVLFQLVSPYLYGAPQPHAWDLPAAQAPVDPALAHPQLLAQLRDGEQLHAALLFLLGAKNSPAGDALFELYEGAL
jgi:hypothetical protein